MTPSTSEQVADVALFLEGTYPYVLGGVSSWVDQIIRGLPELTFALFYLGSEKKPDQEVQYSLPSNVLSLSEVYLHDRIPEKDLKPGRLPEHLRAQGYECWSKFYLAETQEEQLAAFWTMIDGLEAMEGHITFGNLTQDRAPWEILMAAYERFAPDESFIDFFWTLRFLHMPLWTLWKARTLVPRARIYHSVSAGYAGFLGAISARRHGVPFLLTEHGIYTKERIAEISQADWIYEQENYRVTFAEGLGPLKQLWIGLFAFLGRIAYEQAGSIITLYEGNALTQVEFGADRARIEIIPNGIEPSKFDGIRDRILSRWNPEPAMKCVGFVGRVVPIKDVKTLLRAARLLIERRDDVEFLIAGPYSEDPDYFEECQKIVRLLHLENKVTFLGKQKLTDVIPRIDVMVLTSISEGLPLVVLEAMAAGIPTVATDVGACRELIFGRTPEDKALGRAGRLTKILSPQETALALATTLENPDQWRSMGTSGRLRVEQCYTMTLMLDSYRELYREASTAPAPKS
ncbi:MAG: GT4 family glycosyltransferase PelF [Verrucomicrobia bacterium]|nr:GT4 family glycosyltransferase PelF [Verrucomicrobiota bacterium]